MFAIMFLFSFLSFIAFLVGMIKPSWVIRWGNEESKTRKKVAKVFLTSTFIFFILFMVFPADEEDIANKEQVEVKEDKPEEKEDNQKEKQDEDNKEKEKEEKKKQEEEKLAEEEKKKEEEFVFDYDFIDSLKGQLNAKNAAKYFIEEHEKQRVRKVDIKSVALYSSDPVRDQAGAEYPYSTMVTGRYEEKGTGALRDFVLTLVYDNAEDAEQGNAKCAQYFNDDTGTYFNVMNEEDDLILKLINSLE